MGQVKVLNKRYVRLIEKLRFEARLYGSEIITQADV